jgi:DNA polymerase
VDGLAEYKRIISSFREYLQARLGKEKSLLLLMEMVRECGLCSLSESRTNVVFGHGDPNARVLVVGEAPGYEEDIRGEPFVGRAGELLTRMLSSIGLHRYETYITNVIKCRPPGNRNPAKEEIDHCVHYLSLQISILHPYIILALGNFASKVLLRKDLGISKVRGMIHVVDGIKILPTFHPSYLLRNPQDKRLAWEDMKLLKKEIERLRL